MRRILSLAVAIAMMAPALGSVAEAAVGTWLSPTPGQVVSTGKVEVAVGYNTESNVKVTRLELYVDGKLYARKHLIQPVARGVCSFWWDTSNVAAGTHDLVVKIVAGNKIISTVSGTGTVSSKGGIYNGIDMEPPTVKFANIKSGDVLKGNANIKLAAYDNSGQSPLVSLLVDDALKLLRNTAPYNYDLDTTKYADGSHQIKTYAYDSAGNKSDPAVVKVTFKNGSEKPVVASLSVDHNPETATKVKIGDSDTVTAPGSESTRNSSGESAGRTSEVSKDRTASESHPMAAAKTSEPRLRSASVEPTIKRSSIEPKTLKVTAAEPDMKVESAQPKSRKAPEVAGPKNVRTSVGSANLRIAKADSGSEVGSPRLARPSAPRELASPRSSGVRSVSASRMPETSKSDRPLSPTSAKIAAPGTDTDPGFSDVQRVAIVPSPDIHQSDFSAVAANSPREAAMDEPVASGTKDVVASRQPEGQKIVSMPYSSRQRLMHSAPSVSDTDSASVSRPKNMRVAMAPNIKESDSLAFPSHAIACPPMAPGSTKARIEKTTIPSSGKVKARDLFNKLGGVLFWDPSTHTVIAFVHNMKIEMKIGSHNIKVNGVAMHIDFAPRVFKGRTIMEASTYHQALTFAESLGHSAMIQSQGQIVAANGQLSLF